VLADKFQAAGRSAIPSRQVLGLMGDQPSTGNARNRTLARSHRPPIGHEFSRLSRMMKSPEIVEFHYRFLSEDNEAIEQKSNHTQHCDAGQREVSLLARGGQEDQIAKARL
jgi:hypothetical protein